MNSLRRWFAPAALVFSLVLVTACGRIPTAPQITTSPARGEIAAQPDGLLDGVLDVLKGLIVRTLNLVGDLGGTLSNGRWNVVIPSGAVNGNTTVRLGVLTATSPVCQLEIDPRLNSFRKPVTLTADCRSVPSSALASYVIFWWDPARMIWVPVAGSKVDPVLKTVSAPLNHFSKYSVGPYETKAGW